MRLPDIIITNKNGRQNLDREKKKKNWDILFGPKLSDSSYMGLSSLQESIPFNLFNQDNNKLILLIYFLISNFLLFKCFGYY